MRKIAPVVIVLASIGTAHAGVSEEATMLDMMDEFELRQMGMDRTSQRMWRLENEVYWLRQKLEDERYQRRLQQRKE